MRRIRLTTVEQEQLAHLCKTTNDRRLRDRCQAVLMASRERKRNIIAQDLGVHRTTVRLWLTQYHERGVEGLPIHWAPGQPRRMPETLVPTIQEWVQAGPAGCGLERAHWTYEELATSVYQTTGIAVQRTAMRDFCQRHDIRPYRPTYRYLRGDTAKQQAAREELAALKKTRPANGAKVCRRFDRPQRDHENLAVIPRARTTPRPHPTAPQTLSPILRHCPCGGETMGAASHNSRTITTLEAV